MDKLFVQVERVEDLKGRADNYFGFDLCGKDAADATAFVCASKRKLQTNADKLRAMSDEELASYLCKAIREGVMMVFPMARYSDEDVRELEHDWLDWLREEASDEP